MVRYDLHRTSIAGAIREDTPTCVIYEISTCLGIQADGAQMSNPSYTDCVIRSIPGEATTSVTEGEYTEPSYHGFPPEQLVQVAQFVNGHEYVQWKGRPLIQAFRHLTTFYQCRTPPLPEGNFQIGQKSMATPLSYNACMLYRLCTYYGIHTTRTTTIEYMGQAIRGLRANPDTLREQLIRTLQTLPLSALVCISMTPEMRVAPSPSHRLSRAEIQPVTVESAATTSDSRSSPPDMEELDRAKLDGVHTRLFDPRYYLPRIAPANHEEAIVIAAVVYGINLTECRNPYRQFQALQMSSLGGAGENRYVPVEDPAFFDRYMTNPIWYDVRRTWTPALGIIYNANHLQRFAQAEGHPVEDISEPIELLQTSRLTPTFYLGRHPSCTAVVTAIMGDEVHTIQPDLLVTYGIADGGPYTLYSVSELTQSFHHNRAFVNPIVPQESLPKVVVNKLRNLAQEKLRVISRPRNLHQSLRKEAKIPPVVLTEIEAGWQDLHRAIAEVDAYQLAYSHKARELGVTYRRATSEMKHRLERLFTALIEAGFYMRGWKVNERSSYPLLREECTYNLEKQGAVMVNVTEAVREFEQLLVSLPLPLQQLVRQLPLVTVELQGSSLIFRPSNNQDQGLTVIDRLGIIKTDSSPHACIRISSNWITASGYHYLTAMGLPPPFDIRRLHPIS